MITMDHIILATCFCIIFGGLSFKFRAVDFSGFIAGIFVGIPIIIFGGFRFFFILAFFFITASVATKFRYEEKSKKGVAEKNKGARSYINVLGNGIVASIFAILYYVAPVYLNLDGNIFLFGFLGALATAAADTAGGEIGRLSNYKPRLITNLKVVETGADGGITILGEFAELIIAFLIGIMAYLAGLGDIRIIFITGIAGFIGSNIDSIVGATLETWYDFFGNNHTNIMATIAGGILGSILHFF
ncbi:MAG: DUF92 domain-containing protein [Candidatus Methanofastidiosa archaeon]|nr:DUF92 domain-containing protein [Candidatus Methanofastidiosa archaeon]